MALAEFKGSKSVYTLSRILSLFSLERAEIGIRESSQILEIPPGNLHRFFSAMAAVGILRRTRNGRYQLGERLFEVGGLFPLHLPLRKIIRPHVEELARLFGTNASIAIPSVLHPHLAIIVDRLHNLQTPPLVQRISLYVPLHCSAVGKAIFAFLEPKRREEILKTMELRPFTHRTITQVKRMKTELQGIRKRGYALDWAEMWKGIHCVATPILQDGQLVASMSLTDSEERIGDGNYKKMAQGLMDKATFISRQLGG